jgi:hypothetical protein
MTRVACRQALKKTKVLVGSRIINRSGVLRRMLIIYECVYLHLLNLEMNWNFEVHLSQHLSHEGIIDFHHQIRTNVELQRQTKMCNDLRDLLI